MRWLLGMALALAVPATAPVCAASACCKTCKKGRACGDTCIAADRPCSVGKGCACNG